MKRFLSLFLIFSLVFSNLLPAMPVPAAAAEEEEKVYEDGEYDLPFEVWQENKDEISVADGYLDKPAKLMVENGEYKVQTTLKNSSWWQYFKVEAGGSFTEVTEISKDEDADTKVVEFPVEDLDEVMNAKVHIIVTGIPGLDYDNKYDIRFSFDASNIPVAEDSDNQEESDEEKNDTEEGDNGNKDADEDKDSDKGDNPGDTNEDNEDSGDKDESDDEEDIDEDTEDANQDAADAEALEMKDGDYIISMQALHAEEDKASGMARYIEDTADLSVKDGKTLLTVTLTDHKTVTGFQVEHNGELVKPVSEDIDAEANTRKATFELDELLTMVNAQVQYTVGAHNGDQPLRLAFDVDSLEEKESEEETKDPEVYEDGEYEMPFEVWQADKDEVSVADGYLEKPAVLIVEDGKYTVQTTLKNSTWWQSFQVASGDDFMEVKEVSKDIKADTKIVAFEVGDIDAILDAKVHIIVTGIPGLEYDNKYDIRFNFDTDNLMPVENDGDTDETSEQTIKPGETTEVTGNEKIQVEDSKISMMTPADLPERTEIKVDVKDEESVDTEAFTIAGAIIDVTLTYPEGAEANVEPFTLTLPYDSQAFAADEVDIYYYNAATSAWEKQNGTVHQDDGTISVQVDHFSTYAVLAEQEEANPEEQKPEALEIPDGDYTISFEAMHEEEDKASAMAKYIEEMADLSVKNGTFDLTLTVTDHQTVTGFQVENAGELIQPKAEEIDEEANTRTATYELNEVLSTMKAQVQYTAGAHQGDQPLRLVFDPASLQEKEEETPGETENPDETENPEEPEQPGEGENPDESEQPGETENETGLYADGEYELPFAVWQANKDEVSVADGYLEKPATLIVKDGKYTIQTTLKNSSWWQYFKVASGGDYVDVKEVSKDAATDTELVSFEVDDIDEVLDAKVHIIVTGIPGLDYDNKYDIRFAFDTSDIPLTEESNGTGNNGEGNGNNSGNTDNGSNGNNNGNNNGNHNNGNQNSNTHDKTEEKICKDGEYELPFEVWQADKDEISVADDYLEKPAKLIVKDGKFIVQATLKNSSWWQYFKVDAGNGLVDVTELSTDKAADTSVVEFEVQNPNDLLHAKIHVIVTGIPGFDYDNKYDIRFNFDMSDIDLEGCDMAANGNGTSGGATPQNKKDPKDTDVPKGPLEDQGDNLGFNRDADQQDNDKQKGNGTNLNPKTADPAKVIFFSLLFIGSMIPLAIRLRKKWLHS